MFGRTHKESSKMKIFETKVVRIFEEILSSGFTVSEATFSRFRKSRSKHPHWETVVSKLDKATLIKYGVLDV